MKGIALAVVVWLFGGVAVSYAGVNCAQVNRYLATGRSVTDVSETMVIPEEEIRKCQEQAQPEAEAPPQEDDTEKAE